MRTLALLAAVALAAKVRQDEEDASVVTNTGDAEPFVDPTEDSVAVDPVPEENVTGDFQTETWEQERQYDDDYKVINQRAYTENIPEEINQDWISVLTTRQQSVGKIKFDELTWSQYKLVGFTVPDVFELFDNLEHSAEMVDNFRDSFMNYYYNQMTEMQDKWPVCEPGQECRRRIKNRISGEILQKWEDQLNLTKSIISSTFSTSRTAFDKAYTDAFNCDHGCECQYIENHYTYLKTQVQELEDEIADLEGKMLILQGNIDDVHETCDFSDLEADWQAKKAAMKADFDTQLAAVKEWNEDGWELENAVDQAQFAAANNFEYDSALFDIQGLDN